MRAPRIALEKLRFLTWLKYGSPLFDVARTPYPALTAPGVKVALVVETLPTRFPDVRGFIQTDGSARLKPRDPGTTEGTYRSDSEARGKSALVSRRISSTSRRSGADSAAYALPDTAPVRMPAMRV
jgi:hypothetical protein